MNYNKDIDHYNGFKLLSLHLSGNSLMNKSNLFYNFVEPDDKQENIYTTVIIGPNGTGKSNLFRIIIELMKELHDLSKGKNRTYNVDGNFSLKFSLNGDIFEYGNFIPDDENGTKKNEEENEQPFLLINGDRKRFDKAQFPLAIVANSIMLTDKFPFFGKKIMNKVKKSMLFLNTNI